MEKIAVMTWWHYHNYGTALQATALYNAIKKLGFEVDIVNYIPPQGGKASRFLRYRLPVFYGVYQNINTAIKRMLGISLVADNLRARKYDEFLSARLTFTDRCATRGELEALNNVYHAFVCGSDQIWNPAYFDKRYFLDFVKDDAQKIAYAPSLGLSAVKDSSIKRAMYDLISCFKHLSVREAQGKNIIHELCKLEAEVVLDPTLLLGYDEWREIIPAEKTEEKYILSYFLGPNTNAWKHVKAIARQFDLPVKITPIFTKDRKHGACMSGVGPGEFFNLIDNAHGICTDSFHGALFSIICQKPFFLFERFKMDGALSQNSRIYNLLEMTNLQDRLIRYHQPVKNGYQFDYDYSDVNSKIEEQKNKSIKYLHDALSEATRIRPNANSEPLVSVIVPVYNVEQYIKECLDSISNQTYRNIEIIVVDDGTPDHAGEIADECARKDKRIQVIHQENGGLSAARNAGYDISAGEYIVFVDSDDALAPDYVEYMLRLIETAKTDMAMSLNNYDILNQSQIDADNIEIINADKVLENIEYGIWGEQVWNKIYRKSYLDKHAVRHIPEILFGEGNTFNHYVLQNIASVGVGRRRAYYYRYNLESSTRKFVWNKRMQSFAYALEHRQRVIDTKGKRLKKAFQYHVWYAAFYIVREMLAIDGQKKYRADFRKYYKMLRKLIAGPLFSDPAKVSIKYRIFPVAVFFLPKTVSFVMDKYYYKKKSGMALGSAVDEFDRKITQMIGNGR